MYEKNTSKFQTWNKIFHELGIQGRIQCINQKVQLRCKTYCVSITALTVEYEFVVSFQNEQKQGDVNSRWATRGKKENEQKEIHHLVLQHKATKAKVRHR